MIPIIASRPDGLGTRLLAFLHARQLAETLGTTMNLMWPSLTDQFYLDRPGLLQEANFFSIFSSENIFVDGTSEIGALVMPGVFTGKRVQSLISYMNAGANLTRTSFLDECRMYDVSLYDMPFSMPFSDYAMDTKLIKEYWRRLALNPNIMNAFDSINNKYDISNALAVHIRRGDLANILITADISFLLERGLTIIFQRYIPISKVIQQIASNESSFRTILICSEDGGYEEVLRNRFPNLNIVSPYGVFRKDSTEAALLDLMLLATSKLLISPPQSYFSECAATVGKCHYVKTALDVEALVPELIHLINQNNPVDAPQRRAAVYWLAYQNLWWNLEARPAIIELARHEDADLIDALLENAS